MKLEHSVIAVTGAGRGIGQSIALALSEKGAHIAALDLSKESMVETVDLIESRGGTARPYICDVSSESAVERAFELLVAEFGVLHGLVNNAGILRDGLLIKVRDGEVIKKMSQENFSQVVDVHMKGAFLCAREAASHMVKTGIQEGCIINMSSGAFRGNFGQTNYSAAKAGMVAMSRVWSKELGRFNIRSMAIAPGTIDTDMLRSMPPEALQQLAGTVPLGRIGRVDNIADIVVSIFENDYLSGEVIEVNGGMFL